MNGREALEHIKQLCVSDATLWADFSWNEDKIAISVAGNKSGATTQYLTEFEIQNHPNPKALIEHTVSEMLKGVK